MVVNLTDIYKLSGIILLASVSYIAGLATGQIACLGIVLLYLCFRPRYFLHPLHFVFANYCLYWIMPFGVFLIYDYFSIEYLLPWGMINDWNSLSDDAYYHYSFTFLVFFVCLSMIKDKSTMRIELGLVDYSSKYTISQILTMGFAAGYMLLTVLFFFNTGGTDWFYNYSNTYLTGKAGNGLLNVALIWLTHFVAFLLGYMKVFNKHFSISRATIIILVLALILCVFLQGVKSRIPLLLFFYFAPVLLTSKLSFMRGTLAVVALISIFSIGMFFRSEGFYNTPRLAVEYLLSYFDTIFLHEQLITEFKMFSKDGIFIGFNKFTEIYSAKLDRGMYDMSIFLTQIYYPDDWYRGGATKQWPLESTLFLSFPSMIFWTIPISLYCLLFWFIHRFIGSHPFVLFIYVSECLRIFSVFRSTFIGWEFAVNIIFYVGLAGCWILMFSKKANGVESKSTKIGNSAT